jgi:hypothetical protein
MIIHAHAFCSFGLYFWILGLYEVSRLDSDKARSRLLWMKVVTPVNAVLQLVHRSDQSVWQSPVIA